MNASVEPAAVIAYPNWDNVFEYALLTEVPIAPLAWLYALERPAVEGWRLAGELYRAGVRAAAAIEV